MEPLQNLTLAKTQWKTNAPCMYRRKIARCSSHSCLSLPHGPRIWAFDPAHAPRRKPELPQESVNFLEAIALSNIALH